MKKTVTMTVQVSYDDTVTEPDALSNALDGLLEMAMATPNILDNHFPVTVGSFSPDLSSIRKAS